MIVFDLQAVQSAAHGERGIARYVFDLARTLARHHPDAVDVFAWNDELPHVPRLDELDLGDRLRSFSELRNADVDVLHVNSPFELLPYGEVMAPVRARRLVVTCYDLIPYRFPDRYFTHPVARARYRVRLNMLLAADAIVTDSQSAADDVADLLGVGPDRLTVIGAGVGPQFTLPTTSVAERVEELRRSLPDLSARFVLVPAGMDWRKNVEGAVEAYGRLPEELRDRHQLVLACKVDAEQERWVRDLAEAAGIAGHLLVTGYVSDEQLVLLYQTAELVLFPSFYEGFGLPVLEARRCGARVICSSSSSLPEVIPDARAMFNPWLVDEIAERLHSALDDPATTAMLGRVPDPGFTWELAADRLVEVYRRVRPAAPRVPAPAELHRRRLAVVTVLPPTASGIADHSRRLVEAIHHGIDDTDVTVFVEQTASWSDELPYPVHELVTLPPRWADGEFDEVLYCFGNTPTFRSFYPMMAIVPGHVFLHDVRLVGAFDQRRIDLLAHHEYGGNPDGDAIFARPVARRASSVMVQSQHAVELLESDGGGTAIDVGPIPCAALDDIRPIRDGGAPWVVSAGVAHESKLTGVVSDAMRLLHDRRDVRTALVGAHSDEFVTDDDPTVAVGRVAEPEFDSWKWVDFWRPAEEVISFKREVYQQALKQLQPFIL